MITNLNNSDCLKGMRGLDENCIDAIITDPPYGLSFMGKDWDHGIPGCPYWKEALRVAKPGAHMLAFGGTRTHHRLMVAIEDAGWEIRDCIEYLHDSTTETGQFFHSLSNTQKQVYLNTHHANGMLSWNYGSGFPKSLDISKSLDRISGIEREDKFEGAMERHAGPTGNKRCDKCGKWLVSGSPCKCPRPQDLPVSDLAKEWAGWGTALKPSWEPVILCRKPISEKTVAHNMIKWGTGGINIDACRVPTSEEEYKKLNDGRQSNRTIRAGEVAKGYGMKPEGLRLTTQSTLGRFPANLIHDGSEEVIKLFPNSKTTRIEKPSDCNIDGNTSFECMRGNRPARGYDGEGSAARFFYCAKASKKERDLGCESLPLKTPGECTDRKENTAGLNSPRAGAGRTTGSKNSHPTVKPIALMEYLIKLCSRQGSMVLDPFMGSGTTGIACINQRRNFTGYEIDEDSFHCAYTRINSVNKHK